MSFSEIAHDFFRLGDQIFVMRAGFQGFTAMHGKHASTKRTQ